jgi:glycolate oxidase iron-sulfur subunit
VVHGQKIRRQPRELLAQIPGLRVVELPESDWCCGSAGIYNLTQPEMAERLLRRKVRNIEATAAQAVVTANPGCILQIQAGLRAGGRDLPVLHLVELLDRASSSERATGARSEASPLPLGQDRGGQAAARTR